MWESRISRAEQLAAQASAVKELLTFYAGLLSVQLEVYEYLRRRPDWLPSGVLESDLSALRALMPRLLTAVTTSAPEMLATEAQRWLRSSADEIDQLLLAYWRAPSDAQFFAKAFLQPYAQWLIETGARPVDRNLAHRLMLCPHCGGKPQLSFLRPIEGAPEGGGRSLLCCLCLHAWPFRRVVCVSCGEERPAQLAYFSAPEYQHVRIEACDSCGYYLKGVDLTRLGLAVPLVDEVAAAPLDLWAREQGYTKIELNLVGL